MGKFRCRFSKPSAAWNQATCPLQIVLREKGGKMVPVALRQVEELPAGTVDGDLWWKDHRIIVLEVESSSSMFPFPHLSQLFRPAGEATHEDPESPGIYVEISPGRNSYVVTFSPLLSAALGCNTVESSCFRLFSSLQYLITFECHSGH